MQYLPSETGNTYVNVVDSVAIRYLDSIRVVEQLKVRNYAWRDTLFLEGKRSRAWAAIDSTKDTDILVGELEEDAIEERTRIVYRDRVQYKDSIRTLEKKTPYPVEVERKVTPRWAWWSLIANVITILIGAFVAYLKFKK